MSHLHLMTTGLWIRHFPLMSPRHLAHPKICNHTPFRKLIGYRIPTHGFATHVITMPAALVIGTTISLFHVGNSQTNVRLPERNVENKRTVHTKQLPLAKHYEMGHL